LTVLSARSGVLGYASRMRGGDVRLVDHGVLEPGWLFAHYDSSITRCARLMGTLLPHISSILLLLWEGAKWNSRFRLHSFSALLPGIPFAL
jgi:hypothetical protein